jgi:lysozyme family protein
MMSDFSIALAIWLKVEGAYSNDQGGTYAGVTQDCYDRWRRLHGLGQQSVRNVTATEVAAILKEEFWDALNLGALPQPWATFCLVECGNLPWRMPIKIMQGILSWLGYYGGAIDGDVGPATVDACRQAPARQDMAIMGCVGHYATQSNPDLFQGFKRRLAVLRQACLEDN